MASLEIIKPQIIEAMAREMWSTVSHLPYEMLSSEMNRQLHAQAAAALDAALRSLEEAGLVLVTAVATEAMYNAASTHVGISPGMASCAWQTMLTVRPR